MVILKVFNNNVLMALSDNNEDVILTGKGIGFKKCVGDSVDESKVEKTYVFQAKYGDRIENTLKNIPIQYFEITEGIVEKARKELHDDFSSEIFLAIIDHISFALKRKKKGVSLSDVIINETKILYQNEYKVGLWAIDYIYKKTNVLLEKEEAGYIALHLVNYSMRSDNLNASKILAFVKDVIDIIQKVMKITFKEESVEYARISAHLKFLAERVLNNRNSSTNDTTLEMREILKNDLRLAMCVNRIVKLIHNKYNYELSPDEETYLCIHIKRNVLSSLEDLS